MTLARTDKCGNPNPEVCIPRVVETPLCYLTPALQAQGVTCGIPGFKVVSIAADCSGDTIEIRNAQHVVVPGAFEVSCPSTQTLGVGGF